MEVKTFLSSIALPQRGLQEKGHCSCGLLDGIWLHGGLDRPSHLNWTIRINLVATHARLYPFALDFHDIDPFAENPLGLKGFVLNELLQTD